MDMSMRQLGRRQLWVSYKEHGPFTYLETRSLVGLELTLA